jgi:hypothetical protein
MVIRLLIANASEQSASLANGKKGQTRVVNQMDRFIGER